MLIISKQHLQAELVMLRFKVIMRFIHTLLIALFITFCTACGMSYSSQDVINLPSSGDSKRDYEMSSVIAKNVWNGALRGEIKKQIPELKSVDLSSMFGMQWGVLRITSSDDESVREIPQVRCRSQYSNLAVARKVVSMCKQYVSQEAKRYFGGKDQLSSQLAGDP